MQTNINPSQKCQNENSGTFFAVRHFSRMLDCATILFVSFEMEHILKMFQHREEE